MSSDLEILLEQLKADLQDPALGLPIANKLKERDLTASKKGMMSLFKTDATVTVKFKLGYLVSQAEKEQILEQFQQIAKKLNIKKLVVDWIDGVETHTVQGGLKPIAGVKNIIAVASGKGGVGKSTTSVNLALALSKAGARVGILDADIYGPSQPLMLGVAGKPEVDNSKMVPLESHGVFVNSIGFLIEDDAPAILRGPMVSQALEQLTKQTAWPNLDYLVVDMPPGTGDIALTLSQKVPLVGAVIVTTPQDISLIDARKGLQMFNKVNVPVLGMIENMSVHICSECGHAEHIFGQDGGKEMAQEFEVPFLGALPLSRQVREQTDSGSPTVISDPDSDATKLYNDLARRVAYEVAQRPKDHSGLMPKVVVENL